MWHGMQLLGLHISIWMRSLYVSAKEKLIPFVRPLYIATFLASPVVTIYWHYHIPTPGKAIALLGAIAVFMVLVEHMHASHKLVWGIVVTALLITEFKAIDKDRRDYDEKQRCIRQQERQDFDHILQQNQQHFESTMLFSQQQFERTFSRLDRMDKALRLQQTASESRHASADVVTAEKRTLHDRAMVLSQDIATFVYKRAQAEPQLVMPPSQPPPFMVSPAAMDNAWKQLEDAEKKHNAQTSEFYEHFYGAQVKEIVQRLKERGVFSSTACDAPPPRDIIACAAQIQTAAKKLP